MFKILQPLGIKLKFVYRAIKMFEDTSKFMYGSDSIDCESDKSTKQNSIR